MYYAKAQSRPQFWVTHTHTHTPWLLRQEKFQQNHSKCPGFFQVLQKWCTRVYVVPRALGPLFSEGKLVFCLQSVQWYTPWLNSFHLECCCWHTWIKKFQTHLSQSWFSPWWHKCVSPFINPLRGHQAWTITMLTTIYSVLKGWGVVEPGTFA